MKCYAGREQSMEDVMNMRKIGRVLSLSGIK